jgi:hypothetical protein
MAFDFPDAPLEGDLFEQEGVAAYLFTKGAWRRKAAISAQGSQLLNPGEASLGDVKTSFEASDHNGWVLLDGRAITGLLPVQQNAAKALGFATNLPNGHLCALRMDNAAAPGYVGGSPKITVANLPAHNITTSGYDPGAVTSSSAGDHKHGVTVSNTAGSTLNQNGWDICVDGTGWIDGYAAIGANTNPYNSSGANWMNNTGAHTHTIDMPNHTHTIALGGGGTDYYAKALVVNYFCFLGI